MYKDGGIAAIFQISSFRWIYLWQLLRDLQASSVWGCLVGDESKYLDRAKTLFIRVFQLWQFPFHCRSSVVFITPSTSHPRTPFSSTGTWHSCQSCAISEAAGAAYRPAQLSSPSFLFLLTPPLSTVSVYLPLPPRSSASTPLCTLRSVPF